MNHGRLTVYAGPMFSGKTTALIRDVLFETYFTGGDPVAILVPSMSVTDRSSKDLRSHDGRVMSALAVGRVEDVPDSVRRMYFDDIHFFAEPYFEGDFVTLVRALLAQGVDVTCGGLDLDYLGHAFETTATLMAEAHRVEKFTAECCYCPAPATHTARIDHKGPRFQPGEGDRYSPMCRTHWHDHGTRSTGGAQ